MFFLPLCRLKATGKVMKRMDDIQCIFLFFSFFTILQDITQLPWRCCFGLTRECGFNCVLNIAPPTLADPPRRYYTHWEPRGATQHKMKENLHKGGEPVRNRTRGYIYSVYGINYSEYSSRRRTEQHQPRYAPPPCRAPGGGSGGLVSYRADWLLTTRRVFDV